MKLPIHSRYPALISYLGKLWSAGTPRDAVILAGLAWAEEHFELYGGVFNTELVKGEIEHYLNIDRPRATSPRTKVRPGRGTAASGGEVQAPEGRRRPPRLRREPVNGPDGRMVPAGALSLWSAAPADRTRQPGFWTCCTHNGTTRKPGAIALANVHIWCSCSTVEWARTPELWSVLATRWVRFQSDSSHL